jgi:EmrB/QacA subfamily drug resistance transporter
VKKEEPSQATFPAGRNAEVTKRILPWLVAVAFFMELLDTTILNTAVPKIAEALAVEPLSMKSVLSSYTLSLAVFIPISSWIADRFGTRRVFSSAIGLFTFGSFLCGISTNVPMLVASRVIQGMGGAMMVPVGRLTLVRTFPKSELIRAMSFVAIPALIGPMMGPLAGGLIVDLLHWRVIFYVHRPIGLAGLYLVYLFLPDYREKKVPPLDLVGMVLFGSGVALFSYVLEVFGEHSLSAGEILGLFALSLALLAAYGFHSTSVKHPLLRLNLLRIRTLRVGITGGLVTRIGAGGMPFLLPLLYQVSLGYTPIQSGLLIMPQSLAAIGLKMQTSFILSRFGFRKVLLSNTMVFGALILSFAFVGNGTPWWVIVGLSACYGFFSSLQFTCMNTLIYSDTQDSDTSMVSTIASTGQQMSISFGVAVASLVTTFFIPESLREDPGGMINGLHRAFLVLGFLTVLSAFIFRELKSDDGEAVSLHHGAEPAQSAGE